MKSLTLVFVGLILTMGAVGGIDNCTDGEILQLIGLAVAGLGLMAAGVSKLNSTQI